MSLTHIIIICSIAFWITIVLQHFDFVGDFSRHYGIFEGCGTTIPYSQPTDAGSATKGGGGCC